MTVKEMRDLLGMSQKAFAEMYKIPKRTIEEWESGRRNPAPYILELLEYKVIRDKEGRERSAI